MCVLSPSIVYLSAPQAAELFCKGLRYKESSGEWYKMDKGQAQGKDLNYNPVKRLYMQYNNALSKLNIDASIQKSITRNLGSTNN